MCGFRSGLCPQHRCSTWCSSKYTQAPELKKLIGLRVKTYLASIDDTLVGCVSSGCPKNCQLRPCSKWLGRRIGPDMYRVRSEAFKLENVLEAYGVKRAEITGLFPSTQPRINVLFRIGPPRLPPIQPTLAGAVRNPMNSVEFLEVGGKM